MKTLMMAGVLTAAGFAHGELRVYEPAEPITWFQSMSFHPEWGFGDSGVSLWAQSVSTTPSLVTHGFICNLLMSMKAEQVPNVMGYVVGSTLHTYPSGDFTLTTLRRYTVGSSVGVNDLSAGSAVQGWGPSSTQLASRTYQVRDASAPGGFILRSLPGYLYAGFSSFSFVTGYQHAGWAEMQWVPNAEGGNWRVWRWGYETEPGVPARIPPITGCPSDFNGDRDTNAADLSILLAQFGTNVTPGTGADTNGNGVVDTGDLSALLTWFGCNEVALP